MTRAIYRLPWRVDVTVRDGVAGIASGAALARCIAAGLDAAGAPAPASIGLILSDDAEVAELNLQHMGKDGPTDVLSFPLLPPDAFPPHPGATDRAIDTTTGTTTHTTTGTTTNTTTHTTTHTTTAFALPPGRRLHLGDIVVSVERAIEQAETGRGGQTGDRRWAPADELRLLVIHGALHICGWDHAEPAEEAAMRTLETLLLGSLAPA